MDRVIIGDDLFVAVDERVTDAVVIGGNLTVYGRVAGNAVAIGGDVFLGPQAVVRGNAVSVGGTITRESGAEIFGNVTQITVPGISTVLQAVPQQNRDFFLWPVRIITFFGFLALGILIVAVMPTPINYLAGTLRLKPMQAFLWGLLGVMLILPVTLVLIISLVGILLIPLLFLLIALAALIGYIAAGREIGRRISEATGKTDTPIFLDTAVGLLVLWLIGWVPIFGFLVKTLVGLIGFGAVLLSLPQLRTKSVTSE